MIMMSGNTEMLGVKVKLETKERIGKLIDQAKEAGMIEFNGDIYDLFVQNFEQDELAKRMAYGADLKEMQQITSRITDVFINLAQRNDTNLSILNEEHVKALQDKNEDLVELKEKRKELQELLAEKEIEVNQLTALQVVNEDRVNELEKVNQGYTERIEEQKGLIEDRDDKILIKNGLISEKEEAISRMKEDIAENQALKDKISALNTQTEDLKKVITNKDEEIIKQKENLEFECQKRVFEKREELTKEREIELINIREKHSAEVQRYQERYEDLIHKNSELNNEVYKLKSQMTEKDQRITDLENQLKKDNS